jgi:hypothetical protein
MLRAQQQKTVGFIAGRSVEKEWFDVALEPVCESGITTESQTQENLKK